MSDWIEENNDYILEGHGDKFVVGHVLCSKQIPPKWKIKQSPFLLDVHKKFATLGEAKEYCERRYQELFGHDDEITRLRADLAAVTKERDRMREALKPFANMLEEKFKIHQHDDTWIALVNLDVLMRLCNAARAALEGVKEPASPWRDIESAPRDGSVFLAINNRVGPDPRPKGYNPYFLCFCFPPDEGVTYASDAGWREPGRDWPAYPTHWMPLPEPPR